MSRLKYFRALRDHLKTSVEGVRYVARYNRQPELETQHQAFDAPAVFIRLAPQNFSDPGGRLGIQKYQMVVTLFVYWADFSGDGELIEDFIEKVYVSAHTFVPQDEDLKGFGKLMRIEEREDNDHDQVLVHEIDFLVEVMDYAADKRNRREVNLSENISVTYQD